MYIDKNQASETKILMYTHTIFTKLIIINILDNLMVYLHNLDKFFKHIAKH